MEWTDDGIILGVRRHGESSAIVELLTRGHGRHLGLVRGGPSKRMRPMLAELGFGLDLENCAATGETADLIYVSPKSGGAVSRSAGEPFRDRLLRLPAFLREGEGGQNGWSDQDLQDGFRLTGMFLLRHVLEPRGQGHSDARDGFVNAVTKYRARISSAV